MNKTRSSGEINKDITKRNLDYLKMLREIDNIVQDDFTAEMETKLRLHDKPDKFTQEEAQIMAKKLTDVYVIAHGISCVCGNKYLEEYDKQT